LSHAKVSHIRHTNLTYHSKLNTLLHSLWAICFTLSCQKFSVCDHLFIGVRDSLHVIVDTILDVLGRKRLITLSDIGEWTDQKSDCCHLEQRFKSVSCNFYSKKSWINIFKRKIENYSTWKSHNKNY
jgi:hypothetical protein